MHFLKHRLADWFSRNFDLIREEQSSWVIQPRSCQGCLLFSAVFLLLVFVPIGYSIFLVFQVYPVVFSTLMTRLGIASWLGIPLLIAAFLGCFINLPCFVLIARRLSKLPSNFEIWPILRLKQWLLPTYKTRYQVCGYINLNVSGGLIPISLALYQLLRVSPLGILIVTGIVAVLSYFLVTVIPGRAIVIVWTRFWLIMMVASLSALAVMGSGGDRADVAVAFAGGVLGTTIGADLLHLKDACPEPDGTTLSIGGAGLNDGIAQCGLGALIIAEWLPTVMAGFR